MRRLSQRMNPRIRAARAVHRYRFAAKTHDCGFERFLHRQALRLALPADEPGAVIFDRQLVAGHNKIFPGGIG